MRRIGVLLLSLGLVVGAAAGYVGAKSTLHAGTTTAVEVRTVTPPSPAVRRLVVTLRPEQDTSCDILSEQFDLRSDSGRLLAIPDSSHQAIAAAGVPACELVLRFSLSPDLGFFYVTDNNFPLGVNPALCTSVPRYGPYDSHRIPERGGRLFLAVGVVDEGC